VVLTVAYVLVRRLRRPSPSGLRSNRHPPGSADDAMLSQNPAEALRRLAEQRDEP